MIQFKRGTTKNWMEGNGKDLILAPGQPGYDKTRNKLKIGDGKKVWSKLKNIGLSKEEVFSSHADAVARYKKDEEAVDTAFAEENATIITYGTNSPEQHLEDGLLVGDLYLQTYESKPEVDYVVEYGTNGIWTYQKYYSGFTRCWGTLLVSLSVNETLAGVKFYASDKIPRQTYPVTFSSSPTECVTVQSTGNVVWIASADALCNKTQTGTYKLLSPTSYNNAANYYIHYEVCGQC